MYTYVHHMDVHTRLPHRYRQNIHIHTCSYHMQACNQTFLEGFSGHTNEVGSLIIQSSITMHIASKGNARGSGGMSPRKTLKSRCPNIDFGGITEGLMVTLCALISKFK